MSAAIISNRRLPEPWTPPTSTFSRTLSAKIIQTLKFATESKRESESVCAKLLDDIIGTVDVKTREALETVHPCCFFEVLAEYYSSNSQDAESLLKSCRRLKSQNFVVLIYSLLLHKWILTHPSAGGEVERPKYLTLLLTGSQQLFWVDLVSSTCHFGKMFESFYTSILALEAKDMPGPIYCSYLGLLATFMPYYLPLGELSNAVLTFPYKRTEIDGFSPDDFFTQITETLKKFDGKDPGLVDYLRALSELRQCPILSELKLVTDLRLQGQLYSLTAAGGPRYASDGARGAAFAALDALCPAGSRTRKLTSRIFRILHPLDWPRTTIAIVKPISKWTIGLLIWILSFVLFGFRFVTKRRL